MSFGDLLTVPQAATPGSGSSGGSRTRRLSDALLQVVPSLPSVSYPSSVSKLAKALTKGPDNPKSSNLPLGNSEWLESSFKRRECIKIIPSSKDSSRCCCGQALSLHSLSSSEMLSAATNIEQCEHWHPLRHTHTLPTDAHGCIDFRTGWQTNKAQYIRLAHDTPPELVLTLLLREWGLERPRLLITVNGGKVNFELQPKLKRSLRKGLLKAAKTTGAWILTSGTNNGVAKHVGDALVTDNSPRIKGGRLVSIGVAPWGLVDRRQELVGRRRDVIYSGVANPRSRLVSLNRQHACFLLADNGTVGKYGAEIAMRRRLEKFISTQRLSPSSPFSTPLVSLVIEGGTNTIRAVLEYVTDTPPVPVVVCDGTGRAADLIAFAHKYAVEGVDDVFLSEMHDQLRVTIQKTFHVEPDMAARLLQELLQCVKRKNLITIFRCSGEHGEADLDQVILTALFKAQHLSPVEQLSLALTWNRSDIARNEIFVYGQEWPSGSLEQAMQEALENDRVDFVRLLLENGVSMNSFLTISRLERLYNTKKGPANTLDYLVRDVVNRMPKHYRYTLVDIGNVLNRLMGSGFRSSYTRRKFRIVYDLMHESEQPQRRLSTANLVSAVFMAGASSVESRPRPLLKTRTEINFKMPHSTHFSSRSNGLDRTRSPSKSSMHPTGLLSECGETFTYPFSELMLWAVLTHRRAMARLMWHHGEQAMAKALVAARLCHAMAAEAADDDLDVEIFDALTNFGREFEDLSLNLLDYCYNLDHDLTQHLLTAALENWSRKTCLSLAVIANNLRFLAHPLSQAILADLWMGGLRMRKNPVFKIILGLVCPVSIAHLEFKTREQLELMPQTEEELQEREESESKSASGSSATSRRSSGHHEGTTTVPTGLTAPTTASVVPRVELHDSDSEAKSLEMEETAETQTNHAAFFLDDEEMDNENQNHGFGGHGSRSNRKTRPLRLKTKLYEFYKAPITKYYCHSLAYAIFLAVYTFTCLVRMPIEPSISEWYVLSCMVAFGLEELRSFLRTEPSEVWMKLRVWISETKWHLFDTLAILVYLIAFALRMLNAGLMSHAHATFATLICYWYVRSLKLIGVNKYFGPYITMIGKMIENMLYFIVLLLVVLMAFGVCRQSILFPDEEPNWSLLRHIFFQPYFMLYGEVFAPDIDPPCDPDCLQHGQCALAQDGQQMVPCHTGRWITPLVMTVYLLVANILLINLLIASFNTIYNKVSAMSQQLFNFQRFSIVMEYEEKPPLPAPLILICHLISVLKYCNRRWRGENVRYESGLKLFLSAFDLERLFDFEEEGMEGMLRSKEEEKKQSLDARLKSIHEGLESVVSKIQDQEQWETVANEAMNSHEFRLQHIEELLMQSNRNMANLHRKIINVHDVDDEDDDDVDQEESKESNQSDEQSISRQKSETKETSLMSRSIVTKMDEISLESRGDRRRPNLSRASQHYHFSVIQDDLDDQHEVGEGAQEDVDPLHEEVLAVKRSRKRRSPSSFKRRQPSLAVANLGRMVSIDSAMLAAEVKSHENDLEASSDIECNMVTEESSLRLESNKRSTRGRRSGKMPLCRSGASSFRSRRLGRRLGPGGSTRREYTSITDELEESLVLPTIDTPLVEDDDDNNNDGHVIDHDVGDDGLNQAEVEHYQLMEAIIKRRLRRDDNNLQTSRDDLSLRSSFSPVFGRSPKKQVERRAMEMEDNEDNGIQMAKDKKKTRDEVSFVKETN